MFDLRCKTSQRIDRSTPKTSLVVAGASHIGKRWQQQDAIYANGRTLLPCEVDWDRPKANVAQFTDSYSYPATFAIADGMGGHACGEVASSLCIEHIAASCRSISRYSNIETVTALVSAAITEADKAVVGQSRSNPRREGMGTTVVALVVCGDGCSVLNIGDSRCYLYENGDLACLTKDDTEAQRIIDLGMTAEERRGPFYAGDNLTRYVGQGRGGLVVQARECRFNVDDAVVLLCSDGLYKALSEVEISTILGARRSLTETCATLVERSIVKDSADNTSVLLVQIRRSHNG